jgi:hypothetical protein
MLPPVGASPPTEAVLPYFASPCMPCAPPNPATIGWLQAPLLLEAIRKDPGCH